MGESIYLEGTGLYLVRALSLLVFGAGTLFSSENANQFSYFRFFSHFNANDKHNVERLTLNFSLPKKLTAAS